MTGLYAIWLKAYQEKTALVEVAEPTEDVVAVKLPEVKAKADENSRMVRMFTLHLAGH